MFAQEDKDLSSALEAPMGHGNKRTWLAAET